MYAPKIPSDAPQWLRDELLTIASQWSQPVSFLQLDVLYAEPKKKRAGMIVCADGTSWSPAGLGAGVYCYYGGAWNKLG